MKKNCIILFLTFLSISVYSQEFLQLKNGENIEMKDHKFTEKGLKVNLKNREKILLPYNDILGYYSAKNESIYDLKFDPDIYGNQSFYFAERLIDGYIKLYKHTQRSYSYTGGPGGVTPSSLSQLYIEKEKKYKLVYTYNVIGQNKKEKLEILKEYIKDNSELLKLLERENFKVTDDNIIKIIKDYNLSKFQLNQNTTPEKSTVFFFLKNKGTNKDSLNIIINESSITPLQPLRFIPINLAHNIPSKVCVDNYCEILTSSPYYIKYYEILIDGNENRINFTQVKSTDAKRSLESSYNSGK